MKECCIFQLWICFFSNNSVQTNQMLSGHNSSSVPATCQVPTLGCPHQKTNPWEWYLCGISSSPSPYPGTKNITLTVQQLNGEPGATEKKHKGRKGYRAKIFLTAAIPVLFRSRNPPWPCVD